MQRFTGKLGNEQRQAVLSEIEGSRAAAFLWRGGELVGFYTYHEEEHRGGCVEHRRYLDLATLEQVDHIDGR